MPCFCFNRKPKTKRSKRFLESRGPKLVEDVKTAMIMKGGNTSQLVTRVLKDMVGELMESGEEDSKRLERLPAFHQATVKGPHPCYIKAPFASKT